MSSAELGSHYAATFLSFSSSVVSWRLFVVLKTLRSRIVHCNCTPHEIRLLCWDTKLHVWCLGVPSFDSI